MSVEYHQRELAIALDPSHPARAMPPILPQHKRILDVGCGMGQTLLAAQVLSDVEAYGVDCDIEAIEAGRRVTPPNIKLVCARGENLPFEDEYFDLVFSRVALPLMNINKTLREMSRVLKGRGDIWLALHPASMMFSRAKRSARGGNLKDIVFCSYVLLNGALFNCFGIQMSFRGRRQETFQTVGGIKRAMKRAGLTCLPVRASTHFIVQGRKLCPDRGGG
jgi:ubiquinone/menaquinone biosynthesis C-methylase UbiE